MFFLLVVKEVELLQKDKIFFDLLFEIKQNHKKTRHVSGF